MNQNETIRTYFERQAQQFDWVYQKEARLSWLFSQLVRRPLCRRFELTLDACGDVQGKRILDVGLRLGQIRGRTGGAGG